LCKRSTPAPNRRYPTKPDGVIKDDGIPNQHWPW
jgi:hypothetical protein